MNRCPITYRPCHGRYADEGLKRLSPRLTTLNDFPYTAEEQVRESAIRAAKMSIQGVQPKLSAVLNLKSGVFEVVTVGGRFILKPQNPFYPQLPENEDITMRMAAAVGIQTPLHGLIYSKDGSLTYFIKRFDRIGRNQKLAMEDFSPAYELLNTSIAIGQPSEELALPLKGRKRKIDRASLLDYYGKDRLKLSDKILSRTMDRFMAAFPEWERRIDAGFLSASMKDRYLSLLKERKARLFG